MPPPTSSTSASSSIPNYPPPPFLNRNRKLFLLTLAATPVGAYVYLRSRQTNNKNDLVKVEEEGRRAWAQSSGGGGADGKDGLAGEGEGLGADGVARNYGVRVGRSGGGV